MRRVIMAIGLLPFVAGNACGAITYVNSWDGLYQPHNLATAQTGELYVADYGNHRIQKFDASGTFLRQWGQLGSNPGEFNRPCGIAVSSAGNVYVGEYSGGDPANQRVQEFDASGNFIKMSSPEIGFGNVTGVEVGPTGNVYVTDLKDRVRILDSSLNYLRDLAGTFNYPYDVAVRANGDVYVADAGNNRIQMFDSSGTLIRTWGSAGSGNGQFNWPRSIALAPNGDVYVADLSNNRVQVFDALGDYLTQITTFNTGDTFRGPAGVEVSPSGDLYVSDSSNNRIVHFTIPEPSTLVLLGMGAVSLLAYAWRRRRAV
jgi:DNA-binding beta-propeller fold protein YncE